MVFYESEALSLLRRAHTPVGDSSLPPSLREPGHCPIVREWLLTLVGASPPLLPLRLPSTSSLSVTLRLCA